MNLSQRTIENISPIHLNTHFNYSYYNDNVTPSIDYSITSDENTNYKTYSKITLLNSETFSHKKQNTFVIVPEIRKVHDKLQLKDINNERKKAMLIQKHIKPIFHNKYPTDTQKFILLQNRAKNIESKFRVLKRKLYKSVRKPYISQLGFEDSITGKIVYFSLYNDIDIGIDPSWDDNLKYQKYDNDIETPKSDIFSEVMNSWIKLKKIM